MSMLFGSKPNIQPLKPTRMPDEKAPGVLEAIRQKYFQTEKRGGRASTILTGKPSGSGSAPVYQNSTLSGAA